MHAASVPRECAAVNRVARKPIESARSFSSVAPIALVRDRMVWEF
jgi:hypothetical protein